MMRLARDLESIETDDDAAGDALATAIHAANADRRSRGAAPLRETEDPPEQELYRRARALGLARSRG
jgi:hypothetical protein